MSWNKNNFGLPFLPGNSFRDITKAHFHRPQTLVYQDGFNLAYHPTVGIGGEPLLLEQYITHGEIDFDFDAPQIDDLALDLSSYHRPQTLVYRDGLNVAHRPPFRSGVKPILSKKLGPRDKYEFSFKPPNIRHSQDSFVGGFSPDYTPGYINNDKVLRFFAYFKEDCQYSAKEVYCVRPVVLYYYLLDNTMEMFEPSVTNSGMLQGKRIKRHRFPKNEQGDHYVWKDLNLGIDLEVYGVMYHITQCDAFTEKFLEREGVILNDPELMPVDPYTKRREFHPPCHTTPSCFDRRGKFLAMEGKVLQFFAMWEINDDGNVPVLIKYYLVDDSVEIREIPAHSTRRDACQYFRRQRMYKKLKEKPFPRCVLEVSDEDVEEYYTPVDFQLGQRITLWSKNFFLYDCNAFTREYYQYNYPRMKMTPIEMPMAVIKEVHPDRKKLPEIPPYNGYGSLEDSLQNCLCLIPKPPRKNVLKMLENDHKVLHYSARLDSQYLEDHGRCFLLSYHLSTDTISIFEWPIPNSGIISGKFLKKTRILKPDSTMEKPEYYSPADFAIGATIEIFSHHFVLTNAARFVLTYLESMASQIPARTLDSLRQKMGVQTTDN
ncbi:hypothetical protein JOB18_009657 [Solea senegalensis]|uniref:DM10 domain-containing protein n=1 Tax=Solea senegalensis TaxID=28829 RepID=A0AAV6RTG8_SOLSE|nr:EF-hand domain-containing protein 1-like [Solea senegalensis]KAG7508314.1 hypothetical protein JOB18_009657 [Solea senegalensis]KAG7508316.1 hypothetical protein JOB18_009657 [Solea senegalensis]